MAISRSSLLAGALLLGTVLVPAEPSRAEFRVCNKTSARIGLAIGVKEGPIVISQGWFNMKPNACNSPIKEDLKPGPYYVYGVDYDRGGEWSGVDFMCVSDHEFYVEGGSDCYARGYERAGFRRVDTKNQKSWTLDITDDTVPPVPSAIQAPAPFESLAPAKPAKTIRSPNSG